MKPNSWGDMFTPRMAADLRTMLGGGLTFRDNLNCAIVTFDAQHDTATLVANPLLTKPIGVIMVSAVSITTVGGVSDGSEVPILAAPVLDTSRTDGLVSITMRFGVFGACSVYRSAAYNLPDATATRIPVDTAIFSNGSLSFDATNESILCAKPGLVYASYAMQVAASAAGTLRQAFLYKNNTPASPVEIWGRTSIGPQPGVVALSGGGLISVSANDLIRFCAFQDSGGVLALSTTSFRNKLDAHYVSAASAQLARVTCILVGG